MPASKPARPAARPAAPPRSALARTAARRATMTDVATQAGVSQSTVSLVLNGTPGTRLAEATRQRVLDAAQALDYRLPGGRGPVAVSAAVAAGLPAGPPAALPAWPHAPLIVYLADEISTSPHPVVSIDGAKDEAWSQGVVVAVFAARSNAEIESAVLRTMLASPDVVGVIYSTVFTRAARLPAALQGVPTVLLNCHEAVAAPVIPGAAGAAGAAGGTGGTTAAPPRLSSVVPAEVAGGHAATQRLIEAGRRRIAMVNGEPWMEAAQDRLKGYRRALASHDLACDPRLLRHGDWHVASGHDCTLSLMREPQPPDAIFCANDLMAVGCLEALHSLGLRVPEDVSVIGYDDQEIARHTHPPLTTLVLPNYEMGRLAAELLLAEAQARASGNQATKRRVKVEGRIVERATVAPGGAALPLPAAVPR